MLVTRSISSLQNLTLSNQDQIHLFSPSHLFYADASPSKTLPPPSLDADADASPVEDPPSLDADAPSKTLPPPSLDADADADKSPVEDPPSSLSRRRHRRLPHRRPSLLPLSTPTPTQVITRTLFEIESQVLFLIADGTKPMEAVITIDVLHRSCADVTVASAASDLCVDACWGIKLVADSLISDCKGSSFDLIALPGGMPGSASLRDCKVLEEMVRKQSETGGINMAICAALAVALGSWGLLKGLKVRLN